VNSSSIERKLRVARNVARNVARKGATRAAARAAALLLLASLASGCYLSQAAQGQARVMLERKPIARLIADPSTPPALREQLRQVTSMRDFASRELGLPDNGSYRSYADVGRSYVLWNVFAAPEFSVKPKQWCYPIVGCVAYRGYFAERAARRLARRLSAHGYDVAVGGVAAYSTLGHFNDPILNTMLGWDDIELAAIVFHELTHQLLYVPNDSSFNEGLATLVEQEGVRRWLRAQGREKDLSRYSLEQRRYDEVTNLLIRTRADLEALYASPLAEASMRDRKRAIFASLHASYAAMRGEWGGKGPFDAWFEAEINNAHLASIATYERCVPGFARELARVDGDLGRFYARTREIARMQTAARDALVCGPEGEARERRGLAGRGAR
jgi:predicted aminopeptidase